MRTFTPTLKKLKRSIIEFESENRGSFRHFKAKTMDELYVYASSNWGHKVKVDPGTTIYYKTIEVDGVIDLCMYSPYLEDK